MDSFYFEKLSGVKTDHLKIEKLFGEASYRRYYRIFIDKPQTFILMEMPKGFSSPSEEITASNKPPDELPFINIQKFLKSQNLNVPNIIGVDASKGYILLQDLGDQSLESLTKKATPEITLFFYKKAIELLIELQQALPSPRCQASGRHFDFKLFNWEFDHFLEYGIEDRLRLKLPPEEKKEMQKWGRRLCEEMTKMPYGFTHRDFQSRNLILFGYDLFMIDFQDALQGPLLYDLVALLRDSYVELPTQTLQYLIMLYGELRKQKNLAPYKNLARDFYLITLQRKLKDAGRFQFIKTVKGNDKFLTHVPTSLAYVKDAFSHLEDFKPLQQLICKHLPEIA